MQAQAGKARVVSKSGEPFSDRVEAGKLLAEELKSYRDSRPVVLGIPRGGVIIAAEIARALETDLDIILSHKMVAPNNSELAIGAVCEDGTHFVINDIAFSVGADNRYIQQEKDRQMQGLAAKVKLYRAVLPKLALVDRVVIATDDGVATGSTMQAALWAIWKEKPKKVVLALPVGPPDTITCISNAADETVCLKTPRQFQAIGQFYKQFFQVEDGRLLEILRREYTRRIAG
jgi:putative phosphoribosyl transferase